jgi:hypothetical protein
MGKGWAVEINPLVVFPAPDTAEMGFGSNYPVTYLVDVSAESGGGNRTHQSFTYYTEPLKGAKIGEQSGKSLAWTTFAYDGNALASGVTVTVRPFKNHSSCVVAPRHLNIKCTRLSDDEAFKGDRGRGTAGAWQFEVHTPMQKLSVEFDPPAPNNKSRAENVVVDALLVFVDPAASIPLPDEPSSVSLSQPPARYYGPGVHNVGCVNLEQKEAVFVAGGAYVVGGFQTDAGTNDVSISGSGVITAQGLANKGCGAGQGLISFCGGEGLSLEGVTVVDNPTGKYHVGFNTYWESRGGGQCNIDPKPGRGPRVANIKVMGWQWSAPGIIPGRRASVVNSFFRVNDDTLVDFMSHQYYEGNTLWQLDNGWPVQIQWNTKDRFERALNNGVQNVTLKDTTVVHVEQISNNAYGGDYRSVIGAWQGIASTITGVTIDGLRVEGGVWVALFMFCVRPSPFSIPPNKCCGSGSLKNISLSNFDIQYKGFMHSTIAGNMTDHGRIDGVFFKGLTLAGKRVTKAADIPLIIGPGATGVTFS